MDDKKRCNRCLHLLTLDKFKAKKDGNYQKLCIDCNDKVKKYRTPVKSSTSPIGHIDPIGDNKSPKNILENSVIGQSDIYTTHDTKDETTHDTKHEIKENKRFCVHKKLKWHCVECGSDNICSHKKIKRFCIECTPSYSCVVCKEIGVGIRARFHPYCFRCYRI